MITDPTKQKMWEEIRRSLESSIRTPIRSDERTKEQLKDFFGVGNGQIKIIIEKLIGEGKMIARPALSQGKSCTAYRLIQEYEDTYNYSDNESETGQID